MTGEQAGRLLGWLRVAAGVGAWATPGTTARVLSMPAPRQSPARFLLRLFGARDVALGAGLLGARNSGERDRWLVLGMAVDAADAGAALIAAGRGQLRGRSGVLGAAAAVAAIALANHARGE